jgi:hypothetical protein
MSGLRLAVLPLLLAAYGLAVPAAAAMQDAAIAPCQLCATTTNPTNAPPAIPLRLEVETRLDFDKVVFDGKGAALVALSPGGITRLTGAASAAGARAMPGSVIVRGEPGRAVTIELPARVQLFGSGTGNGAILIDSLVTDLPPIPRLGTDGTLSFRFGGDLRLSGEGDGAYHGTIDITVEYL